MDTHTWTPESVSIVGAMVALLTLAAVLHLLWHVGRRWMRRRAMAAVRERGAAGEALAEKLLARWGYRILGRQVVRRYTVGLDGQSVEVELRADFVVARNRRRYVAEVKTGRLAPRLDTSATRRQLLEYRLMFDVHGVLLVDAEAARVHEIVFPLPAHAAPTADAFGRLTYLFIGIAAGATGALVVWTKIVP